MGSTDLENKPWLAWRRNHKVNPEMDGTIVPLSCCRLDAQSKPVNCTSGLDVSLINQRDCFTEGLQFVKEHAVYLGGVAIGISCFMVSS